MDSSIDSLPRTSSVRHLSSWPWCNSKHSAYTTTVLTTDKCSTAEVNAIKGSAVALLAYQISRLEDTTAQLSQSSVVLQPDKRTHAPMDRTSEQRPKVQRDHLGGCLSLTVRNTVCPDTFAGTVARKRLTEAARSLHPLSSTLVFAGVSRQSAYKRHLPNVQNGICDPCIQKYNWLRVPTGP